MKTEQRIYSLLEERSFPNMILLDGNWGVGKTHFVKSSLKPFLEDKYSQNLKTIYLSLYGITSLEDFKDRILSLAYTENKKSSWIAEKYSELTGSGVQVFEGTRGVGAALGTVASIVKSHYFSKLDNLILFLDDLERVSSGNIKSEILGECLNLTENKNIKIVFIANLEKIKYELKDETEKVFSEIVHFRRTSSNLMSVLGDLYSDYEDLIKPQEINIKQFLDEAKLDNLRIIRRSIDRYISICNLFERCNDLDYTNVDYYHLKASFSVCTAIYQHGFSLDEVISVYYESPYIKNESKEETEAEKRKKLLRNIIHPIRYNVTENLIKYIATYDNCFKDITIELNLPISNGSIQEMLDYKFRKNNDRWLTERLVEFRKFIEHPRADDFVYWMRACSVFAFLIKNGYVSDDFESFKEKVKNVLPKLNLNVIEDIEDLNRELHYYVHDEVFKELFSSFLTDANENKKRERIDSFKTNFLNSWKEVADIARNQYHMTPFINYFNCDDFKIFLDNWNNEDICDFNNYLRNRYDFGNIGDFFASELKSFEELLQAINFCKNSLPVGAKRGVISELEERVKKIHIRLLENVKAKNLNS